MPGLIALRICLTLGALIGLLPVTVLFIYGLIAVFAPIFFIVDMPLQGVLSVLGMVGVSAFGLWTGWKTYGRAMAERPSPARRWLLLTGALLSTTWGVAIGAFLWKGLPTALLFFMSPGVTSCLMLAVVYWRTSKTQAQHTVHQP